MLPVPPRPNRVARNDRIRSIREVSTAREDTGSGDRRDGARSGVGVPAQASCPAPHEASGAAEEETMMMLTSDLKTTAALARDIAEEEAADARARSSCFRDPPRLQLEQATRVAC